MDRNEVIASRRPLTSAPCHTHRQSLPILSSLRPRALQHPALSHPAEDDSIHHSLDLSFQRAIAISSLDRQIIDSLPEPCHHLPSKPSAS